VSLGEKVDWPAKPIVPVLAVDDLGLSAHEISGPFTGPTLSIWKLNMPTVAYATVFADDPRRRNRRREAHDIPCAVLHDP